MQTLIDYFRRVANYDWWVVSIELFLIGIVVYWAVDFLEGASRHWGGGACCAH